MNGLTITWYQNKKDESLFYFMKRKVAISLLIKDWSGENTENMLSGLISVIRISLDAAHDDKEIIVVRIRQIIVTRIQIIMTQSQPTMLTTQATMKV